MIRYASRVFWWSVVVVVVFRDGWFDGLCSITIIQFRSWLLADADFSNKPYRLQSHQDWIPWTPNDEIQEDPIGIWLMGYPTHIDLSILKHPILKLYVKEIVSQMFNIQKGNFVR